MKIFYKREKIWCKWPDNDQTEYDMVHFSTSKKHFDRNIVLKLDPQMTTDQRITSIAETLKLKKSQINLQKL